MDSKGVVDGLAGSLCSCDLCTMLICSMRRCSGLDRRCPMLCWATPDPPLQFMRLGDETASVVLCALPALWTLKRCHYHVLHASYCALNSKLCGLGLAGRVRYSMSYNGLSMMPGDLPTRAHVGSINHPANCASAAFVHMSSYGKMANAIHCAAYHK